MFEPKPYEPTPDLAEPPEPARMYRCAVRECTNMSENPDELCDPVPA